MSDDKLCVTCSGPLPKHKRRYCSDACGLTVRRVRGDGYTGEYGEDGRICPQCGRSYAPTPGSRLCPECSAWNRELCRHGGRTSTEVVVRACAVCGALFVVRASSEKQTCGRECKLAHGRLQWARRYRPLGRRRLTYTVDSGLVCLDCGEEFEPYAGCTQRCRRCVAKRQREIGKDRQRQQKYGERGVEPVLRSYIMERDGWRCHLCGERISPRHEYPHPRYGSLDHLVPFSKGGPYRRENIRAAHLKCNLEKNTRAMNEQLLLLG